MNASSRPNSTTSRHPTDVVSTADCTPIEIDTAALRLSARLVPWDSESFGRPVAQVNRIEVRDDAGAAGELRAFADWLARGGFAFASCRLPHDRLHESFALEAIGFRFVEMVYAMEICATTRVDEPEAPAAWCPAVADDLNELQRIAAAAFVTGRWNIDWRVGASLGGARYADWIRRSLDDPRHEVLKAVDAAGTIVAFFIIERRADGSAYWHLTAVSPECQGRGLGHALWRSMVARHATQGIERVATTISARNIPVINLYAKLGWRFVDCQTTLQWAASTATAAA